MCFKGIVKKDTIAHIAMQSHVEWNGFIKLGSVLSVGILVGIPKTQSFAF